MNLKSKLKIISFLKYSIIFLPSIATIFVTVLAVVRGTEVSLESEQVNLSEKRFLRSLDNPNLKTHDHNLSGPQLFHSIVKKSVKYTDKIVEHKYSEMYGTFLLPYIHRTHKMDQHVKFFEIGLGCDAVMTGNEARGFKVWKSVLGDKDDLWIAEYNLECVEKAQKNNLLPGVQLLTGDQSDRIVLQSWIKKSGGQFNIIIDDGGHYQHQILNSFTELWPQLKMGGLYFIEDFQVARTFIEKGSESMMNYIYNWQEYMITGRVLGEQTQANLNKYKPPPGIKWIACQAEACVIAKCDDMSDEVTRCTH